MKHRVLTSGKLQMDSLEHLEGRMTLSDKLAFHVLGIEPVPGGCSPNVPAGPARSP